MTELAAPALATVTQPIASHWAAESAWFSMTTPTSAATAGSRLIQMPNTRAGTRRSASSSNRYGITDESRPISSPLTSAAGRSSALPALATAASAAAVLIAGSVALCGLALLMAGTLRAEATLAAANLVYLVLLGLGGIVFPLAKFPASIRPVLRLLPAGAMSDGVRAALRYGVGLPARDLLVLAAWAVIGIVLAARTFRWE